MPFSGIYLRRGKVSVAVRRGKLDVHSATGVHSEIFLVRSGVDENVQHGISAGLERLHYQNT